MSQLTQHNGTPEYSIVVPAHNEERYIGACVRSLARQNIDQPYEVVLVDNNCTDRTVTVARENSSGLNLRVIQESRQGRGAARRAGFKAAHGRVLFSADADTIYPRSWLQSLLHPLREPGVVAATTTARIADLSPWQNLLVNVGQPLAMWCYRLIAGHHCMSGFSSGVLRAAYDASGGFDGELNADEDADLSRRVARLGSIRLVYAPVTMSGRRFSRGLLPGAFAYIRMSWEYRRSRTSAQLSDVR